jgi:hypothetical protein
MAISTAMGFNTLNVGAAISSVAVGDFNGDVRPDLAVANLSGTVSILLNNTPACLCSRGTLIPGVWPIHLADPIRQMDSDAPESRPKALWNQARLRRFIEQWT